MPDSVTIQPEILISELPPADQANAADQLEANQDGTTRRITLDQVSSLVAGSTQISGVIDEATASDIPSVKDFGAVGDGVADDTAAFQAAVTAAGQYAVPLYGVAGPVANTVTSWVYVPPGTYRISSVTFPAYVGIRGGTVTGRMTRETVIKHFDPTASCFILPGRNSVRGFYFDVNNTNVNSPTATPPTIASTPSAAANEVSDCIFQFAYIAIGAPSDGTSSTWTVNNVAGFFHHRLVYLKNTTDISYVSNLHGGPVESTVWSTATYAHANRVLVEMDNADGLVGENWFIWGGRGIYKHSGGTNLIVSLQNITGENITHGIDIASGSTNAHHISIDGGYVYDFDRVTADGFAFSNAANVTAHVSNFRFQGGGGGIPGLVQVSSTGSTFLSGCTFLGSATNTAIRKTSVAATLTVSDSYLRGFATFFSFAAGCDDNLVVSPSCVIQQGTGSLYSASPTGLADITQPLAYTVGAGNTPQTVITRRTPGSDHALIGKGSFLVHQQGAVAVGVGGMFEATGPNGTSTSTIGSRAAFKCYATDGTVGNEAARAHIRGYTAGAYGPAFVVFEKGGIGYQGAQGAGGTVTQATDKSAAVTLDRTTGQITMNNASLAAGASVSFTFNNATINQVDILHIKYSSGGTNNAYRIEALEAALSATVTVTNTTAGALAQAIVLKFYVFKTTAS